MAVSLTFDSVLNLLPEEVLKKILLLLTDNNLTLHHVISLLKTNRSVYNSVTKNSFWRSFLKSALVPNLRQNGTWYTTFLATPRVRLDGIYGSKVEYYREGEIEFGKFYPKIYEVTYHRLIRFYQDGTFVFLTTPNGPKQAFGLLSGRVSEPRNLYPSKGVYEYAENGTAVTCTVTVRPKISVAHYRFSMAFKIGGSGCMRNRYLHWQQYTVSTHVHGEMLRENMVVDNRVTYPRMVFYGLDYKM